MAKSLRQLEKEYAEYIAETKIAAKKSRSRIIKRRLPVTVILSKHVTTVEGGKARWGKFREWTDSSSNVSNLKKAIRYAKNYLNQKHIGTIIYIGHKGSKEALPIFEAKWGHDGQPFTSWKNNPMAGMWKRRVNS